MPKKGKDNQQVSILTYARLKPLLQLSEEQALERVEIHNNFQRDGGVVDYEIETVQVEEEQGLKVSRDLLSVTVPPDVDPGLVHYNNDSGDVKFEFDKVFDTDTRQEDVFEEVVAPKVQVQMSHLLSRGINPNLNRCQKAPRCRKESCSQKT